MKQFPTYCHTKHHENHRNLHPSAPPLKGPIHPTLLFIGASWPCMSGPSWQPPRLPRRPVWPPLRLLLRGATQSVGRPPLSLTAGFTGREPCSRLPLHLGARRLMDP